VEQIEKFLVDIEKYRKYNSYQNLLVLLTIKQYQGAKLLLGRIKQELVVNVAINYLGEGLEFMDLINEGNIGLLEGINSLSEEDDIDQFLSPFIKESIQQAIRNYNNRSSPNL
jgi:DNA-directed RNA polymerase sigma subunit (sigma70/sigma32)